MIFTDLIKKSEPELKNLLADLRAQLRVGRWQVTSGKLKNVRKLRVLKKEIAQVLTRLNNLK